MVGLVSPVDQTDDELTGAGPSEVQELAAARVVFYGFGAFAGGAPPPGAFPGGPPGPVDPGGGGRVTFDGSVVSMKSGRDLGSGLLLPPHPDNPAQAIPAKTSTDRYFFIVCLLTGVFA